LGYSSGNPALYSLGLAINNNRNKDSFQII